MATPLEKISGTNQYIDPNTGHIYTADQIESKQFSAGEDTFTRFVPKANAIATNDPTRVGLTGGDFDERGQYSQPKSLLNEVWGELATAEGIQPFLTLNLANGGEGRQLTYVNPAFTQYIEQKKAEGVDVSVQQVPGFRYKFDVSVTRNGQPVSAPQRVQYGQGAASSISEGIKNIAPALIAALTAGAAAPLGAAMGATAGSTAASALGGATIAGGVTALGGGSLKDVATNALLAGAVPYAKEALGLTGGMSSELTPEMQATIASNPQGAFLGESAIPSGVTSPTITGYDLGAAAPLAGSAGDMMTGVDMSGNIVNSLTGEVLVPATSAPINALTSAVTQPSVQPAVAEAATTPPTDTTAGLSSADRAALLGNEGYGAGMTGAQTGAFDTTLGLTGSTALAAGAANVAGAAGTAGNLLGEALDFVTSPAGSAVIGAVGSVAGGVMAANAAEDAARQQSEAAKNELALLTRMYEEGVARQAPFLQGGTAAFNRLVGLQTGGPEAAQQFLQMDPGYGFRLGEGMKALERQQAARGNLLSGGAIKAGQRYAQDVASQEYGSAYNRLAGLANLGPQAAGVMSNLGQQYATSAGGAMQDAAAYQGAGTLGRTSAYMGAIQGGLNALSGYANQQQQNQLINRLLGGG